MAVSCEAAKKAGSTAAILPSVNAMHGNIGGQEIIRSVPVGIRRERRTKMRIRKPREDSPAGISQSGTSHFKGRKAIKEPIWITNYINLECGHLTTPQEDEVYRLWRPRHGPVRHFCDVCGKWRLKAKPYKPESLPDTPLF